MSLLVQQSRQALKEAKQIVLDEMNSPEEINKIHKCFEVWEILQLAYLAKSNQSR